jgi:hypothetical protein
MEKNMSEENTSCCAALDKRHRKMRLKRRVKISCIQFAYTLAPESKNPIIWPRSMSMKTVRRTAKLFAAQKSVSLGMNCTIWGGTLARLATPTVAWSASN